MPLYTDAGYSYYGSSSGGMYSPYYSAPQYGSSSSSPYAPYSSSYNRSYSGTYSLPTPSRSAQYAALVSRYQPKLSTITESPLTSRSNFIPLTRIHSPKISTYTPSLPTKYISSRPLRPRTISTADIDVSATSRYGRHHHMAERKKEEDKIEAAEEAQSTNNTDSDTSSSVIDPNSPYMPRVDGTDTAHHARSTIKRNRAVVRLSMMRPRSKGEPKEPEPDISTKNSQEVPEIKVEKPDPLERLYIHDKVKEEGIKISVTDMIQSQTSETSQNELIIEVDPITHTVRRLSIPQVPSFHDICEDISSDKIDDDLNAGVLRRRASLIQEQEIEILNELQKSQSGTIQVIHLERNASQEDCRKSRKSRKSRNSAKTKKIRHKITANVEIDNSPLTPVIQQVIEEEGASATASPTVPKFTFNIDDIEEHKVFKLPKKRVKSIKAKKPEAKIEEVETGIKLVKPDPPDKEFPEALNKDEPPKSLINKISKSESSEDFWAKIGPKEVEHSLVKLKPIKTIEEDESTEDFWTHIDSKKEEQTKVVDQAEESNSGQDFWSQIEKKDTEEAEPKVATPKPIKKVEKSESSEDFWSQIGTRETLYMNKRKKALEESQTVSEEAKDETPNTPVTPTVFDFQPINTTTSKTSTPTTPKKTLTPSATDQAKKTEKLSSPKKSAAKPSVLSKTASSETSKDESAPSTPKKITSKSQDSPKSKPQVKAAAKKKSSPKINAKEETSVPETTPKTKAKPSASTRADAENIASPKISSGSGAKSPEKKKSTKSDTPTTKESITKNALPDDAASKNVAKKSPEKSVQTNKEQKPLKQELKKPLTPTSTADQSANTSCDGRSDSKSPSQANAASPPPASSLAKPETKGVTSSPPTPAAVTDVSPAQVPPSTTTISSPTTTTATATSSPSAATTKTDSSVLGISGSNNLSKFATVSNLAEYLLDVDAELEDYIPSSAEETDSSSDSYSGDGNLSASMKKKNKQLRKKAKQEQQAFDPNKKVKIDTKKKCYVKEEKPRYPLIATPRPLWKREKVVYEESSTSSSEETESDSECTTSDEYEDELIPKDAIIRMSTSSNDSGFDGGTAPPTSKKALGTHEARDSPCSPLSLNPAYKIEANDDETSYTYLQFQKSGRITAPATTIPRFKKYSVEDFHFLAVLGKGSFGKVLLAELRNTDFYYAVKCLKKDVVLEDDDVECTLIERKVLALGTKHPYLCHLFCTFQTESHLFFVMEYLNGGDLMFHIQESGRFPEDRARFYGAEIISGLKFLHKKGIIYRDLKLDNVLLDFDGHVRIADFGMCKLQIYLDKTADSFCGTPDYMAPEIIKGDKYNQNVDWWSFGVLLYEMLIGQSPFSGCDEDELFWSICNEIPWFPVYITKEATSILKGLLEKDYTRRVGSQYSPAGDIADHIFFKDIDWGLLEKRQLPPPFKPQVKHPLDTQYFDRAFTRERVRLTPIDKEILQTMDQEQFQGFSYTNPNATLD